MLLEQEWQDPLLFVIATRKISIGACTNGYLTTANQRELREANRALV